MKTRNQGTWVFVVLVSVMAFGNVVIADVFDFEDGGNYTINDSTYQDDEVWLDRGIANNPGTHVSLQDGGTVFSLEAWNNATVTISGGSVTDDVWANGSAFVTISGGTVGSGASADGTGTLAMSGGSAAYITAHSYSNIIMSGGVLTYSLVAYTAGTVNMSGGYVGGDLMTYTDGTIYLDGTGFEVTVGTTTTSLTNRDRLSDFGALAFDGVSNYYTGTITGTLSTDGSALDNTFKIWNTGDYYAGTADIVVIPEPATFLLIGMGGLALIRKRWRQMTSRSGNTK